MEASARKKKVLAVASSGGHWVQLLRLRPAFAEHEVVFVTTQRNLEAQVTGHRVHAVPDANQHRKLQLLLLMLRMLYVVAVERPDIVISTGAAPGYFALRFGRLFGARTLWLESIAGSEQLSLSAKLVKPYADLLLTQWPHLAAPGGPQYRGSVL